MKKMMIIVVAFVAMGCTSKPPNTFEDARKIDNARLCEVVQKVEGTEEQRKVALEMLTARGITQKEQCWHERTKQSEPSPVTQAFFNLLSTPPPRETVCKQNINGSVTCRDR